MISRRACALLASVFLVAACRPSSVAEAEAKGNAPWLDTNGSAEAVAALGRLSDKNPRALELLKGRARFDLNAYIAAWTATKRGADWGPAVLRAGLASPDRANDAASAMQRKDPLLATFVPDLEGALTRVAAGAQGATLGGMLASVGPAAHAAIEHRLKDGASRGAMCQGIASQDSSADARTLLMAVPQESRDHLSCVIAVMNLVQDDDVALTWLASTGEPGLLGAVGKNLQFPCARMHILWRKALGERSAQSYHALEVPLSYAIKRCATSLDGVLSDAIVHVPAAHGIIVAAIDPYGAETSDLKATCGALHGAIGPGESAKTRERANDELLHGCKGMP